jgi:hypothetical protein
MQFKNEAHLQEFLHHALIGMGVKNKREVVTDNGSRIDILSDQWAIEVKPVLHRSALFQSAGQMSVYKSSFPGRELVLAGIAPSSEPSLKSAIATAARIQKEMGIQVWFIDQMPEFQEAYASGDKPRLVGPDHGASESLGFGWVFVFGVILLMALFYGNKEVPKSAAIPAVATQLVAKSDRSIIKTVNIRKSPEINDQNLIGQVNPGDVITLTGRTEANADAVWAEIENDRGDRAWIARSAIKNQEK